MALELGVNGELKQYILQLLKNNQPSALDTGIFLKLYPLSETGLLAYERDVELNRQAVEWVEGRHK
jgi:hypothetical protein